MIGQKDRIMKDCAEKLIQNKKLLIRSPNATRPWQHVIEPLIGYLILAEKMYKNKIIQAPGISDLI